MKAALQNPLLRAILAGAAVIFFFKLVLPSFFQTILWPASSSITLVAKSGDILRSIQILPKSQPGFYPPALIFSLRPAQIRILVYLNNRPFAIPVLLVNCRTGIMEVDENHINYVQKGYDVPLDPQTLQHVFDRLVAQCSPPVSREHLDVKEIYEAIQAIRSTDICDKAIPTLSSMHNYSVDLFSPYKRNWFDPMVLMVTFTTAMSTYRAQSQRLRSAAQS